MSSCMDFFFTRTVSRYLVHTEIPEETYLDEAAHLAKLSRAAVVVQAHARGKWTRDVLGLQFWLALRLQAMYRARVTRATPLAKSLHRFLVERRRTMALERSLGHMP